MKRFIYTAINQQGASVSGFIESDSREAAVKILSEERLLTVVSLRETRPTGISFFKKITLVEQVFITRSLGIMISSGLDLMSALGVLSQEAPSPFLKKIIRDIHDRILAGESLSEAFGAYKGDFHPLFSSMLRAGETSGNLDTVLRQFGSELARELQFSRKIKAALFYPLILVTALAALIIVLLAFVIPNLQKFFLQTKIAVPTFTKIVFGASNVFLKNSFEILAAVAALILIVFLLFQSKTGRNKLGALVQHLPFLKDIYFHATIMRFSRTFANLLNAGISFSEALTLTAEVLHGKHRSILAQIAEKQIEKGVPLSEAIADYPRLFPPMLKSLIAAGEKSGELAQVLLATSEYYEEETLYRLEKFVTVLEPLMLIVVGGIIGVVAGSIIFPIYRFLGGVGGP